MKHLEFESADFDTSNGNLRLKQPEEMVSKLLGIDRDTIREIINDADEGMHDTGSMLGVKEKWQKRSGNFK